LIDVPVLSVAPDAFLSSLLEDVEEDREFAIELTEEKKTIVFDVYTMVELTKLFPKLTLIAYCSDSRSQVTGRYEVKNGSFSMLK